LLYVVGIVDVFVHLMREAVVEVSKINWMCRLIALRENGSSAMLGRLLGFGMMGFMIGGENLRGSDN